jgi:hypothetical protein
VAVLDSVVQALTAGHSSDVTGAGQFAIAPTGTLAWIPGPIAPHPEAALVTVDRRGQVTPLAAPVRSYMPFVRLSPDGRRLTAVIQNLTEVGLWLCDLGRGSLTLLTGGGEVMWPVWAPDGRRIAFSWRNDGRWSLVDQPADGTAPPRTLASSAFDPSSWTPDGRQLAGVRGGDIIVGAVQSTGMSARPWFETPHIEGWPAFSPDGRWMAYASDVSGRHEVYVRPYPGPGPAEQVTIDGGMIPAWNPSGRELFFLSLGNPGGRRSMMAVEFQPGSPPRIGRPSALFDFDPTDLRLACEPLRCYDVAPDGQRFYGWQRRGVLSPPLVTHISLMTDFFEVLKAKVPAR